VSTQSKKVRRKRGSTPGSGKVGGDKETKVNGNRNRAQVVKGLIAKMEKTLGVVKPTVGDFIRLLQLQKDLDEDEVREVTVTWVEQSEKEKRKGK